MKKLEIGKTYIFSDGMNYIRVLKNLPKYETYLCDTISKESNMAYRTTVEYDATDLYSETEDSFDDILSSIPEYKRSHALRLNK